jgi:hypothetical protein
LISVAEPDESEHDAEQHDEYAAAAIRRAQSVYESTGEIRRLKRFQSLIGFNFVF